MPIIQPFELRDFRQGVIRKSALNTSLIPLNSVSESVNINYDTIIGSAVVRSGCSAYGNTVASNKTPLGLSEFAFGSTNRMVCAYSGATTASLYYFNGSWAASNLTTLNNTAKVRFATIGGQIFMANGVDVMATSVDGQTWYTGASNSCIATDSVIPSLLFRSKSRLLAGGYSGYRDRVYFSSIISPASSPKLTWNTNTTTGDWIDINPDDGSNVTGFAETSGTTLVFKGQGMYRLDVITKTVDTSNIFNIGAVSQEAIVECLGEVYFFSGYDIRRTNGGYPEQISRLGVQDFIDSIPQTSWTNVALGTDGLNVYVSCGNVTVGFTTYNNLVLKYSPRDQSWSVHSYTQTPRFFCQYTTSLYSRKMFGADSNGDVLMYNIGMSDNGKAINFYLKTQELEFGNRAHTKGINEKLVVFTNYGLNSRIDIAKNDDDYVPAIGNLNNRVNVINDVNISGNYFTLRWSGTSLGKSPILEGFYIESIDDEGISD